jgi:dipeptidyl aminopeptidase/acylaminoacyl peptidase
MTRAWVGAVCVVVAATASMCRARAVASPPTGFFQNGDVRLSYQLTKPDGRAPVPAVVIGHGSGEVRKEFCRSLASIFLRRGYATLCYDKRGVGQSTGEYSMVGTRNSDEMFARLAGDMAAGVRFLRAQPGIDGRRVGLVGGSQAGWIIPLAAKTTRPAFMIILSGPTVTVGEEIYFSRFAESTDTAVENAYAELDRFTGARGFDPRPVLESLETRGLWLIGLEDRSIPVRHTLRILDELIAAGRPFQHVDFPGADHGLRGVDIGPAVDRFLDRH